jgi:hypothetical protein
MNDAAIVAHLQGKIGGTPHICTKDCKTSPLRVHVHEKDGQHIRWSGNNQIWMGSDTFVRALQYVYVCHETRTVHHCTRECMLEPISNDDHTLVCPVSGVQWDDKTEVVRSWKLTSKCVPSIVSDKRDPNMYSRDASGTVLSRTLNIKDESCRRSVRMTLHMLVCSQRRKSHELEKFRMSRQHAMKQVNRYIKYAKQRGVINMSTAMNIYTTECFRRVNFLRVMHVYEPHVEKYTERLYPTIRKFWSIINSSRMFTFETFVPAMLYIMQRGVCVDGVFVIEPVHVLEIVLPDANVLDEFDIAKSTFTQTKNAIRASVRALLKKIDAKYFKESI